MGEDCLLQKHAAHKSHGRLTKYLMQSPKPRCSDFLKSNTNPKRDQGQHSKLGDPSTT